MSKLINMKCYFFDLLSMTVDRDSSFGTYTVILNGHRIIISLKAIGQSYVTIDDLQFSYPTGCQDRLKDHFVKRFDPYDGLEIKKILKLK